MSNGTRREVLRRELTLSLDGKTPDELRRYLSNQHDVSVSEQQLLEDIDHLRQSLRHDEQDLLVRPPECEECGFDNFDTLLGVPSQCPDCRSEWIAQPVYTIE